MTLILTSDWLSREHLKDVKDSELPEQLVRLGRYEDKLVDVFGADLDICDLCRSKHLKLTDIST